MKPKRKKALLIALGALATLGTGSFFLLRHLVDPESFRAPLRSRLEAHLGRPVDFGAVDVSLWPVGLRLNDLVIGRTPDERFDDPVRADRLRVGTRLVPLIRGRLEITSVIVDAPVVLAYQRADGSWEPSFGADEAQDGVSRGDGSRSALVVEHLRVRRGRIVVRSERPDRLPEAKLTDVDLSLDDLGRGGRVPFKLSADSGSDGKLTARGSASPQGFESRVEIEDLTTQTLREWLSVLAPSIEPAADLLADRPFSAGARLEYTASSPVTLDIADAFVRGPALRLSRSLDGDWNLSSVVERIRSGASSAAEPEIAIRLVDLSLRDAVLVIEDGLEPGRPATLELSPLQVDVSHPRPEGAFAVTANAAEGRGRGAIDLRLEVEPPAGDRPVRLRGNIEVSGFDPAAMRIATSAIVPDGALVGRAPAFSSAFDITLAERIDILLRDPKIRQLDLAVSHGGDGSWHLGANARPAETVAAPHELPRTGAPLSVSVERLEVTDASMTITTTASPGEPASSTLSIDRLTLDRLPELAPSNVALDVRLGRGSLAIRGSLGPIADAAERTPVALAVALDSLPLAAATFLPAPPEHVEVARASASANLTVEGSPAGRLRITGSAALADAAVRVSSPRGATRVLPLAFAARGDLVVHDGGARIDLPQLELELPGNTSSRTLSLGGFVAPGSSPPRFDVELRPTRIPADDLAALVSLVAPNAPLTFASTTPVDLQLRASGVLGTDRAPALEGSAALSDFTLDYSGMTRPMERVSAKVRFAPDRVAVEELSCVIGSSDLSDSRITVDRFDIPRIEVDIRSRNADFWELFSFVRPSDPDDTSPALLPTGLSVAGDIRIERGSLHTLSFRALSAAIDAREDRMTLSPLAMELYGGRFSGALRHDLKRGELVIEGSAEEVEANDFLAANLGLGGVIAGRTSAQLNLRVRTADPADVLAGTTGGGPISVLDGQLTKIEVLRSLSKVAGVFGERSLKRLTRQLSTRGTAFTRAETRLALDGGKLSFEDVVLETPELTLAGNATLLSTTGALDGRFAVAFSPGLSAEMRAEKSRAAELFWDTRTERVSFAFVVRGTAAVPDVKIDWESAARGAVERKLVDRVRRALGANPAPEPAGEPQPAPSSAAEPPATPSTATEDPPPIADHGPTVRIDRTRWTGPALLRDLVVEGTVEAAEIDRLSFVLRDDRGIEIQKIDRVKSLDAGLAGVETGRTVNVPWSVRIEGKRLALAGFPVTATVTLHLRDGRAVSSTHEVRR